MSVIFASESFHVLGQAPISALGNVWQTGKCTDATGGDPHRSKRPMLGEDYAEINKQIDNYRLVAVMMATAVISPIGI